MVDSHFAGRAISRRSQNRPALIIPFWDILPKFGALYFRPWLDFQIHSHDYGLYGVILHKRDPVEDQGP